MVNTGLAAGFSTLRRLGLVLAVAFALTQAVQAHDRAAARKAFRAARASHEELLKIPESQRTARRYSQTIFLYRTVIDHDPTYGAADDSLFSVAELYEEMARRFNRDLYRRRAVYYYEFVAREYPSTKHRKQALRQAAALRKTGQQASKPPARKPASPPASPSGPLADVQDVRYWSNEDYTRVVIETTREVEFTKSILSNPDRIYFDLDGARLTSSFAERNIPINDLFIRQLRVAQNQPGVVRVVLDFDEISSHTVFALYDPFRIVIDTRGGRRDSPGPEGSSAVAAASASTGPAEILTPAGVPPVVPASNLDGERSLTRVLGLKVGRVVIDPGHGGHDTGTIGPSGLKEKDLVLSVALKLKDLLEQRLQTEVIMTRDSDRFVPLEERTAIANQLRADLFLSIHANSSRHRKVTGVETFFLSFTSNRDEREVASRENASSQRNIRDLEDLLRQIALGDFNEESKDLAQTIQASLHSNIRQSRPDVPNRGIKTAPFIVLINLNMPGILTEVGFISNKASESFLSRPQGQVLVAEGLFEGVQNYLASLGAIPAQARAETPVESLAQD